MIVKIKDIKTNPNNPRVIRDEQFKKLVKSIQEFPEMLSVRKLVCTPDMIVLGGNMRLKALQSAGIKEVDVEIVDWDEHKQKEFIIKDNVSFGEWNHEQLANEWDAIELQDWGLDIDIDAQIDVAEEEEEIVFAQSVQLEPPQEYIVLIADANSEEWEEIKDKLKLKIVRKGGYKAGSPFDALSIERVIAWSDFKGRYVNSSAK